MPRSRLFIVVSIIVLLLIISLSSAVPDHSSRARPASPAQMPFVTERHVCLSECPYTSIQSAVDAANNGDVIKVASGTYTGVNVRPRHDITITGFVTQMAYISKTVTIQGGYTTTNWLISDPVVNPTTLDAQGQGRVMYITGNISPTIEGLRLIGGNAVGLGGAYRWGGDVGGGIYAISATAIINDNLIFGNIGDSGGGLYLLYSPDVISRNTIIANTGAYGGGLWLEFSNATLSGNSIISNVGDIGGGMYLRYSDASLNNNIIASNIARLGGGGYLEYDSEVFAGFDRGATLSGNVIVSNTAKQGGGLFLGSISSSNPITISNSIIAMNTAISGGGAYLEYGTTTLIGDTIISNTADIGGGLCLNNPSDEGVPDDLTLINGLIAENQGHHLGSGLYIGHIFAHVRVIHTTITRNIGGDGSGVHMSWGATLSMTNTVVASQTVGITVTGSTARLEGALWGIGAWGNGANWGGDGTIITGTINIFGDPDFVNPEAGDYHIGPDSAARRAGINAGVLMDIDQQPRHYQNPDIGADEYWSPGELKYSYRPIMLKSY